MDGKDLRKLTESIDKKLGSENSAIIADDIGTIMTGFETMDSQIKAKDEEIASLKKDKEKLVLANGNLLKQVTVTVDNEEDDDEDVAKKPFNFRDAFDEKGNFKK